MRDWVVGLSFSRLTFVLGQHPFAELRNSMETAFLHEATLLLLRKQHPGSCLLTQDSRSKSRCHASLDLGKSHWHSHVVKPGPPGAMLSSPCLIMDVTLLQSLGKVTAMDRGRDLT